MVACTLRLDVVEPDLDGESDGYGFIVLARRFEAPFTDGVHGALIDVFVDGPDDVDVDGEAVRTDGEADQDDAADAKALGAGIGLRTDLMDQFRWGDALAEIENRLIRVFIGVVVLRVCWDDGDGK